MATKTTDAPTLEALRARFGDAYAIRRTPRLWIATRRDDDPLHAPTIIEGDFETFIHALENPPARAARPYGPEVIGS